MTIDDVMKLTPEQVQRRVAELTGGDWDYHKDLNLAMQLVPQGLDGWHLSADAARFFNCLHGVVGYSLETCGFGPWTLFAHYCPNKPLALCRAYILWKKGAK